MNKDRLKSWPALVGWAVALLSSGVQLLDWWGRIQIAKDLFSSVVAVLPRIWAAVVSPTATGVALGWLALLAVLPDGTWAKITGWLAEHTTAPSPPLPKHPVTSLPDPRGPEDSDTHSRTVVLEGTIRDSVIVSVTPLKRPIEVRLIKGESALVASLENQTSAPVEKCGLKLKQLRPWAEDRGGFVEDGHLEKCDILTSQRILTLEPRQFNLVLDMGEKFAIHQATGGERPERTLKATWMMLLEVTTPDQTYTVPAFFSWGPPLEVATDPREGHDD